MSYNIYRAARKAAAEKEPRLASCESAQELVNIERNTVSYTVYHALVKYSGRKCV